MSATVLDLFESARLRDEAMERAEAGASMDWRARALIAVHRVATEQPSFLVDSVWAYIEKPEEPRAIGPIMQRACRNGWITKSGQYEPSAQTTTHSNPRPRYISHLYDRKAA